MWSSEFDASYAIPDEILALVQSGEVTDLSWHNDACPSFGLHSPGDDHEIKVWVEHPEVAQREGVSKCRFLVWSADAGDHLDTDDVHEAIRVLRVELASFKGEVQPRDPNTLTIKHPAPPITEGDLP